MTPTPPHVSAFAGSNVVVEREFVAGPKPRLAVLVTRGNCRSQRCVCWSREVSRKTAAYPLRTELAAPVLDLIDARH
jgi:hypothetical protein